MVLLKVVSRLNVGVDLTDEGYYFNWISNPWLYQYYASQFGFVYHPIYKAFGSSIVSLRLVNVLVSFGLSFALCYCVLRQYTQKISRPNLLILSACLALPSLYILMITGYWLPSPSYNSLNFQGCLLAVLGFYFSGFTIKKAQVFASLFIGVGGWLVFMAKPSSAFALSFIAILFFLPTIKRDWKVIFGAAVASMVLLVMSAILIDGSVTQFIKRYQGGFMLLSTLSDGYGIGGLLRLDLFHASIAFKLKFLGLTSLIAAIFFLHQHDKPLVNNVVYFFLMAFTLMALVSVIHPSLSLKSASRYHTLLLLSVTFGALLFALFAQADVLSHKPSFRFLLLLLFIPYIYAIGTGNNYWQTAAGASVFWVLAAVLLLAKRQLQLGILTIVVVFVVSISANCILDAMQSPYRQSEGLLSQNTQYIDPHSKQVLELSKDTANYLNTLKSLANKQGFQSNTPVIDLTGHHPGSLYFMQAKSIGLAWMSGGHPKSNLHVEIALYQATCEHIASAWLLLEKDGRRSISESILKAHGIIADKATYSKVGKLDSQRLTDAGALNPSHPNGIYQQYLLKPVDVEKQTENCINFRKTHKNPLSY